jgi:hypothetical protein
VRKAILTGIVAALVGVFPLAALVAHCFRFPIPFAGYESGASAALRSLFAVLFYGMLGGFLRIAALGAIASAVALRVSAADLKNARRLTIGLALAADFAIVLVVAVLDKIVDAR